MSRPAVGTASQRGAQDIVAALIDAGVRRAVLCPGSRSAPLAYALHQAQCAGRMSLRVVLDERSAAFIALGMGRAHLLEGRRRPAVVVTTSGTAVANLHPAVAEADAAGVPLLVLSADRPHELVGTGANQTTEQTRILGDAPRVVVDLPADLSADLGQAAAAAALAGQVRRAVLAASGALSNDPGPAQINVRFRPPLAPSSVGGTGRLQGADDADARGWGPAPGSGGHGVQCPSASGGGGPARLDPAPPLRSRVEGPAQAGCGHRAHRAGEGGVLAADSMPPQTGGHRAGEGGDCEHEPPVRERITVAGGPGQGPSRGLVIAGDAPDPALGALAVELSEHMGWPLLAEPTSQARGAASALPRYAELLDAPAGSTLAARATHAVVLGHPSLSRAIGALLARTDLDITVLAERARITDVAGTATRLQPLAPGRDQAARRRQARHVAQALGVGPAGADWARAWRSAVAALPVAVEPRRLSADTAALAVWESCTGEGAPSLMVGSSMTIRRLDRLAPTGQSAPCAVANRGLAGIDGTVATAAGLALARGRPVRAVMGDLSFLHDAMSLACGRLEEVPDLQVIVLDDAGGAIFTGLEYAKVPGEDRFARLFTTPQRVAVGPLAAALGAVAHTPATLDELEQVLAEPVRGLSVVHLSL